MAIYESRTFSDIYTAVLDELKLDSSDTTTLNRIKRNINMVYQELAARKFWPWRRRSIALSHQTYISTGTVAITAASQAITFSSAPAYSVAGYLIKFDGHEEIYRIYSHTAAATAATLSTPFSGSTAATSTYKLWTDALALPVDCDEVINVSHQWVPEPLQSMGIMELKKQSTRAPVYESYPLYYSEGEQTDPNPYSGSAIATSASRSSSGHVRTVVFGSDVSASVAVGSRIQISAAGHAEYNIEAVVSSVSTTTITYTALTPLYETSTADTGIVVKTLSNRTAAEMYKKLYLYPSLYSDHDVTLHVEYAAQVVPLENDSDEPLMDLSDRIVLVYGSLARDWVRQRNDGLASNNLQLYEAKIAQMEAQAFKQSDKPNIFLDPTWIRNRKARNRYRW